MTIYSFLALHLALHPALLENGGRRHKKKTATHHSLGQMDSLEVERLKMFETTHRFREGRPKALTRATSRCILVFYHTATCARLVPKRLFWIVRGSRNQFHELRSYELGIGIAISPRRGRRNNSRVTVVAWNNLAFWGLASQRAMVTVMSNVHER